jgi:hypothetical protein
MEPRDSDAATRDAAGLRDRAHHVAAADTVDEASRHLPGAATAPMMNSDDAAENLAIVELLLCASDLARNGVQYALSMAVDELDMQYTLTALVAALEARDVGALYGEAMNADAYLEAAYRVMQRDVSGS